MLGGNLKMIGILHCPQIQEPSIIKEIRCSFAMEAEPTDSSFSSKFLSFILSYGFALKDNKYDSVPFKVWIS
jgi:hypothetical protein